jgi:hypothetical protein
MSASQGREPRPDRPGSEAGAGPRWGRAPPGSHGQQRIATVSRPRRSAAVSERSPWSSDHPNCLSHGGSQGFKSPHLHPTTALVTGLAGHFRRAAAVPRSLAGQQTGSNRLSGCRGAVGPATGRYGAFGAALGAALLAGKMLPPRVVSELYHATSATWTEQLAGPALLPFVRSAMNAHANLDERLVRSYVARRYAIGPLSRGFEPMRRVAFCLHESGLRHFLGCGGSGSLIPSQNRVR